MRILILSQWYNPEPGKAHDLGRELVSRGHQVTAITGYPNYPEGRLYPGYRQSIWQVADIDGVRVVRLPLYPNHDRSGIRRTLNYLSFAATASVLGPILSGGADVMWVYHPPLTVGIPACWLGLLRRVPFIYEIQDMWPETLAATGMVGSSRALALVGAAAELVYNRAAAINVISDGFKRNLVSKGIAEEKVHVISNWADEETYCPVPPDPDLARKLGMAGRFNVVFAGNLGLAQALDTVLNAAARLQDIPSVQLVLVGDGVDEARLKDQVVARSLQNVRFVPRQPAERMPDIYALADALLIHLRRDPLFEITVPSKTLAYLACGRPIICAVLGDAADVVRSAGAGICCEPQNPEALAAAVRRLRGMSEAESETMGQAGRQAFLQNYTRRVLVDRYEALMAEVASGRNPTREGHLSERQTG